MDSLQHHFLIATPSMKDTIFERAVIYICEHNEEGAMGIIINLPINITVDELLTKTELPESDIPKATITSPVYKGGPVSEDRGFVLHTPIPGFSSSMLTDENLMLTTSIDVLTTLGTDKQPGNFLLALGYTGWSEGQLEQELAGNSWLTVNADLDLLFNVPIHKRWEQAAQKIGINIWQLSNEVGHS